jgi:hypothetical protein
MLVDDVASLQQRLAHLRGLRAVVSLSDRAVLETDVPGHAGHRLRIVLEPGEALVEYDDSLPPGPAEQLFIFSDDTDGLDAVADFVASFTTGRTVAVRRKGTRLRGSSQMRFVSSGEKLSPDDVAYAWDGE